MCIDLIKVFKEAPMQESVWQNKNSWEKVISLIFGTWGKWGWFNSKKVAWYLQTVLVELKNRVYLNISHENSDRVETGLQFCICGKEVAEWKISLFPTRLHKQFLILSLFRPSGKLHIFMIIYYYPELNVLAMH